MFTLIRAVFRGLLLVIKRWRSHYVVITTAAAGSTRDVNPSLSDDGGWEGRLWEGGLAASAARPTRPAALEEHTSDDRGFRHWRGKKTKKETRAGRSLQVSRSSGDARLEIKGGVIDGCDWRSSFSVFCFLPIFGDHNHQNQLSALKSTSPTFFY